MSADIRTDFIGIHAPLGMRYFVELADSLPVDRRRRSSRVERCALSRASDIRLDAQTLRVLRRDGASGAPYSYRTTILLTYWVIRA